MLVIPKVGLSRPSVVARAVYGTITLMSGLIVYDGWQQLRFRDVVGVIAGPVLTMFLSHLFAATLAKQVELGRSGDGYRASQDRAVGVLVSSSRRAAGGVRWDPYAPRILAERLSAGSSPWGQSHSGTGVGSPGAGPA
jgi:hypothetical protein